MVISVRLGRTPQWRPVRWALLLTANLTWVSLVLMIAALIVMMTGRAPTGEGIIAHLGRSIGWANRLLVVAYCVWAATVARQALHVRRHASE
jgi:hypothetical protein